MTILHPEKLVAVIPNTRLDQIVDIITGSFSIAAATFSGSLTIAQASDTKTPIANDFFHLKGIWSIDGVNWNQMGNDLLVAVDPTLGNLTLSVGPTSTGAADATPFKLYINASNQNYNTGYTIQYKLIVMARFDQELIGVKPLIQPLRYSSKNKYMKPVLNNKTGVLPTAGTTVIPHNLGYIPNFDVWILFDDTPYGATEQYMTITGESVSVDTSNLYIDYHSFAGVADISAWYRVYLNA